MAFYKRDGEDLLTAPNFVHAPGFSLKAEDQATYTYPQDGWYWFDNLNQAMTFFSSQPVNGVPVVVTRRQALQALNQSGKLADVYAAIDGLPEPTKTSVKIDFDSAQEFRRDWPVLLSMQPILGMTDTQLEELFILAASL